MIRRSTSSFVRLRHNPAARIVVVAIYYLLVQAMLFAMYAYRDFVAPSYIYQEF
jgi:hypothetical protein